MPDLPDWGIRLARADEHLDALEAEVQGWIASEPYRITDERDPESGHVIVYAEKLRDPPFKLPAILGDAIQNLRACLDYIALALSERNYGSRLPDGFAGICHYPICKSQKKFSATRKSCVPHIASEPLAIIERTQPYRSKFGLEGSQLSVLKALSDFDKHRGLPLIMKTGRASSGAVTDLMEAALGLSVALTWPLEQKAELFRYKVTVRPDASASEMDMYPDLAPEICFADGAPAAVARREVTRVCSLLFEYVATEVVLPLKPYL